MFNHRNHKVACFVTHLDNPLLFLHYVTDFKDTPHPLVHDIIILWTAPISLIGHFDQGLRKYHETFGNILGQF